LAAATPSLKTFLKKCHATFGNVTDNHFSDEVFRKLVAYEIAIRMHAKNRSLIPKGSTLEFAIDKLRNAFSLTEDEIESLHNGRKFLNKIKHHEGFDFSWINNVILFEEAYSILSKYNIKII
jgi:hypothetical protein